MENTVKAEERLDTSTANKFDEDVMGAITGECEKLYIDMEDTTYISSICLRTLRNAFRKMKSQGGIMVLKNVKPSIMEILEITGFAGNFIIE